MIVALQHTGRFVLLLLMLGKMLAMPLAILDYQWNTAFIAENLCENKDKPQMSCHGKCHMKKQVEKANDAPESGSEKGSVKTASVEFIQELTAFQIVFRYEQTNIQHFSDYSNNAVADGCNSAVFRPPVSSLS
jgi:hypothetical protein